MDERGRDDVAGDDGARSVARLFDPERIRDRE